eukprot:jgi/Chlat1/1747/Chrsp13S02159
MVALAAGAGAGAEAGGGVKSGETNAARLAQLQRKILSWDFFQLNAADKKDPKAKGGDGLREVPLSFDSIEDYLGCFEPLLLEECRAQLLLDKERTGGAGEVQRAVPTLFEHINDFGMLKILVGAAVSNDFNENDVLLLSFEKPGETATPKCHALAIVEAHDGEASLRLRMHLEDLPAASGVAQPKRLAAQHKDRMKRVRTRLDASNGKTGWWIVKLASLSTISREYLALHAAPNLPFSDILLSGSPRDLTDLEATPRIIPESLLDQLTKAHNEYQLQAVLGGLEASPVTLIQGPPGTGKTQTLLGLLSVILHSTSAGEAKSVAELLDVAPQSQMTEEERKLNWLRAAPWQRNSRNVRDAVTPVEDELFTRFETIGTPDAVLTKLGKGHGRRAHVLVCAPSNSALDELVLRMLNSGIPDEQGKHYVPNIVRVGLNPHHSVHGVCMDTMVNQRLNAARKAGGRSDVNTERDRIRLAILDEAAIVCSTLSFSGSAIFSRVTRGFDVVVIDEAAQAVEPSTLVPLAHGCKKVILVGDPIQLPATVLSSRAVQLGYGTSMFKRFQQAGHPVHMLRTQYRMHPEIRVFPSNHFYGGSLEDGANILEQTTQPWHKHRIFGPFAFFNVNGKETTPQGGSHANEEEAVFALAIYQELVSKYPQLKEGRRTGVISPYKAQVKLLRTKFTELFGKDVERLIDINTVDGFQAYYSGLCHWQGREMEIAIFSCVRSKRRGGIGFLSDERRMNVGLTRARSSMLVIGSAAKLSTNEHWGEMVSNARERQRFFQVPRKPNRFAEFFERHTSEVAEGEAVEEAAEEEEEELEDGEPELGDDEELEGVDNLGDIQDDLDDAAIDAAAGKRRLASEQVMQAAKRTRVAGF